MNNLGQNCFSKTPNTRQMVLFWNPPSDVCFKGFGFAMRSISTDLADHLVEDRKKERINTQTTQRLLFNPIFSLHIFLTNLAESR